MTCKRIRDQLLAYTHLELSAQETSKLKAHLAKCDACTEALRQLEHTAALLGALERKDAPPSVHIEVRGYTDGAPSLSRRVLWTSCVTFAVAAVLALSNFDNRERQPQVHLHHAKASDLEQQARALHQQRLSGALELQLKTTDIAKLKAWTKRTLDIPLELANVQPPSTADRIKVVGATSLEKRAGVLIALKIDKRPVSLLVWSNAHEAFPEGRAAKNIFYARDRANHALLWSRKARSYVLISDLPNQGRLGCFGCHTDQKKRRLIREMKLRS